MYEYWFDMHLKLLIFLFASDSETGLVTTQSSLDREFQDIYQLLLVVQDGGSPPQQATRLLKVQVLDVDDHKPLFQRNLVR